MDTGFIHSKSEKVCGVYFSVTKKSAEKVRKCRRKILATKVRKSKHIKGHLAPRVCHVMFLDQRDIPGSLSVT